MSHPPAAHPGYIHPTGFPGHPKSRKKKVLHDVPGAFNYLGEGEEGEEEADANDGDVILLPVVGGTMAGGMLPGQRTDEDLAGNNIRGERKTGGRIESI